MTVAKKLMFLGAILVLGGAGCAVFTPPSEQKQDESNPSETEEVVTEASEENKIDEQMVGTDNNSITVVNQNMVNNSVTIKEVKITKNGWVAIQQSINGQLGLVVGATFIKSGTNSNVIVPVKKSNVTNELYVTLRADKGTLSAFDFGGVDPIIEENGEQIKAIFKVLNLVPKAEVMDKKEPATKTPSNTTSKSNTNQSNSSQNGYVPPPQRGEIKPIEPIPDPVYTDISFSLKRWTLTPSTVEVKKDAKIRLTATSADEHSYTFALPAYGVSLTLNPGESKTTIFDAFMYGDFDYNCTIFCENHPEMAGVLFVK